MTDPLADPAADPDMPPALDEDTAVPSTLFGPWTEKFVDQFRALHAGTAVQLLLTLHPGLHHQHLADTVGEVAGVNGVANVAWVNRPGVTYGMTSPVRAVLTGYQVSSLRPVDEKGSNVGPRPLVVAFHPPTGTALMTGHLAGDDDTAAAGRADQRGLTLADMVDQALCHHAEISDLPEPHLPAWEAYVRCDRCGRMAPADPGGWAGNAWADWADWAGRPCVAQVDGAGGQCQGTLRMVQVLVTGAPASVDGPVAGDVG